MSNTTDKEDGILCFRDTMYTIETIPNPLNISCRLYGRFVIYYNNRTNYPFPEGYTYTALNHLCEIEVYGNLIDENVISKWSLMLYLAKCIILYGFTSWLNNYN